MWINSIFCRYFQENLKPRATFLSGARQPEEDFSHSWAMILNKFWGQIVSLRVKTLNNKNFGGAKAYLKEKKAYFWLKRVAQKRRGLLKLPIDFEGEDCDWDSDYDNHRSEIVVKLI